MADIVMFVILYLDSFNMASSSTHFAFLDPSSLRQHPTLRRHGDHQRTRGASGGPSYCEMLYANLSGLTKSKNVKSLGGLFQAHHTIQQMMWPCWSIRMLATL